MAGIPQPPKPTRPVLPIVRKLADRLRELGYSIWIGVEDDGQKETITMDIYRWPKEREHGA